MRSVQMRIYSTLRTLSSSDSSMRSVATARLSSSPASSSRNVSRQQSRLARTRLRRRWRPWRIRAFPWMATHSFRLWPIVKNNSATADSRPFFSSEMSATRGRSAPTLIWQIGWRLRTSSSSSRGARTLCPGPPIYPSTRGKVNRLFTTTLPTLRSMLTPRLVSFSETGVTGRSSMLIPTKSRTVCACAMRSNAKSTRKSSSSTTRREGRTER